MKTFVAFLLLLALLASSSVFAQADSVYQVPIRSHVKTVVNVEATLFGMANLNDAALELKYNGLKTQFISWGGGISFFPEFRRGKRFSVLIGMSAYFLSLKNYRYSIQNDVDEGIMYNGSLIGLQLSPRLRWTFGHKLPVFFQLGFAGGPVFVQGRGEHSGVHSGALYNSLTHGYKSYVTGVVTIVNLGLGIRKTIAPGVELISYIEGAPLTLQASSDPNLQQYFRFNLGFSFSTKKH